MGITAVNCSMIVLSELVSPQAFCHTQYVVIHVEPCTFWTYPVCLLTNTGLFLITGITALKESMITHCGLNSLLVIRATFVLSPLSCPVTV